MADKDFKTIEEQIEILRSRGLSIEDEAEAKDFLLRLFSDAPQERCFCEVCHVPKYREHLQFRPRVPSHHSAPYRNH